MLNNNFLVKLNNLHESNFLILRRLLQYQTPCLVVVVRNPKELYHLNRIRLHRLSFSQNTYVGYIVFPNGFRSLHNFLVLLYCHVDCRHHLALGMTSDENLHTRRQCQRHFISMRTTQNVQCLQSL